MTIKQGKPCHSSNYYSYRNGSVQYIVIHFTGNNGDTAQDNCSYFAGAKRGASAHYFVGTDGIYQSVPDNCAAWAVGGTKVYKHKYCRNMNSISIEMCSRKDSGGRYYIEDSVVSQTVELTKYLMNKYGVDADHVIRHYDVWDKKCPEPFVRNPQLWTNFKARLKGETEEMTMAQYDELNERLKKLENPMVYNYIDSNMPSWAHEAVKWCVDKGIIGGTDDSGSLGLTNDKLWQCVVMYRLAKTVSK